MRYRILMLLLAALVSMPAAAQQLLDSTTGTDDLFDKFQEDGFTELTDQEIMKQEMVKKRQLYDSLLTQQSPVFFKADRQEINEAARTYHLSGNVTIWKDKFKIKADDVLLEQWSGAVHARGNVEIHFGDDLITGSEALYNVETGQGWVQDARAAVKPSIFMEAARLERLALYEKTGDAQYALHDGFITACTGKEPDWRIKTRYALVRIENYAHVNRSSFWVSKLPVFYTPYWFYPTKTGRATGLLLPNVNYSNRKGFIFAEEFFLVLNDYMDMTFGATYYSVIGLEQNFQWRNAFSDYSRGEMTVEHIKEKESPSDVRNPQERWKGRYEQNYVFPFDIRGTVDMDFRSDQDFDADYGYELEQERDRFMESRVSLTKNWDLAHLTLDGTYEKDFDKWRDETMQHIPRLEFNSGSQTLFGDLKGSISFTAEYIQKESAFSSSKNGEFGSMVVDDWLKRNGTRMDFYPELSLDVKEVAWFTFTPWVGLRETVWDLKKTYDPDHPDGSWATYASLDEPIENRFLAGIYESDNWIRREMYRFGFDFTGPRFYRIFPLLGYEKVSKIKHLVEPGLSLSVAPDVVQDTLIYFDDLDRREGGRVVTLSLTNRFLAKIKEKTSKKKDRKKDSGNETDVADDAVDAGADTAGESDSPETAGVRSVDMTAADKDAGEPDDDTDEDPEDDTPGETTDPDLAAAEAAQGTVREFGNFTISQSYDFLLKDKWDEREEGLTETEERALYPFSNIKLDATVNPFQNIFFSARVEFDPFRDDFATGYLYGHMKTRQWKFGVRWDYSKNFDLPIYDLQTMALEGGAYLNEHWSFSAWVKYDFSQEYFHYANLDLTYTSQCWALTLHTYYENDRTGIGTQLDPYVDDHEIQFGLSITLKNLDSVGPRKFGKFFWGDDAR